MPVSAAQIIADFVKETSRSNGKIVVQDGLSAAEAERIANVNNLIDNDFQEVLALLKTSTGLSLGHEFDFRGLTEKAEGYDLGCPQDLICNAVDIGTDDCGNKWVVEILDGRMAHVLFLCHDPATIVFEASNLSEFLHRALRGGNNGELQIGNDDGAWYKPDGGGRIEGDTIWFDLRDRQPGRSVPLSLYYDHPDTLRRHGPELLFSMPRRNRGRWQRFRDRWR